MPPDITQPHSSNNSQQQQQQQQKGFYYVSSSSSLSFLSLNTTTNKPSTNLHYEKNSLIPLLKNQPLRRRHQPRRINHPFVYLRRILQYFTTIVQPYPLFINQNNNNNNHYHHHHYRDNLKKMDSSSIETITSHRLSTNPFHTTEMVEVIFMIGGAAVCYIISGVCQPILMQVCQSAGLANSSAQLYMLAYYTGPACLILSFCCSSNNNKKEQEQLPNKNYSNKHFKDSYQPVKEYESNDIDMNCTRISECNNDNDPLDDEDNKKISSSSFATSNNNQCHHTYHNQHQRHHHHPYYNDIPSSRLLFKASMIAFIDIIAQCLNYTGASLAGATIFAVIYSSVTIWTAVFSYCFLHRSITRVQWFAICLVVWGLAITALDSITFGPDVVQGTVYILFGSALHAGTYVFSEALMTQKRPPTTTTLTITENHETLSPRQNSAIQGLVAFLVLLIWQLLYTIPRWDELIQQRMDDAGTSIVMAIIMMSSFAFFNLIHSLSFYYTLQNFPGGATSAGIMKGLQAVLVSIVAHLLYCHNNNKDDNDDDTTTNNNNKNLLPHHHPHEGMCFSRTKFYSLVTVVSGVILFSLAKKQNNNNNNNKIVHQHDDDKSINNKNFGNGIHDVDDKNKNVTSSSLPMNQMIGYDAIEKDSSS